MQHINFTDKESLPQLFISLYRYVAYNYATKNYDAVAILSAKYGLLLLDDEIEPYELTLKTMTGKQFQRGWTLSTVYGLVVDPN